jgi:hypothetical protein
MIITVKRYYSDDAHTKGLMFINGRFACYTLEDAQRCKKISGQTAIPNGVYNVDFRRENTPLTAKYKDRFDWFTYHLQLLDVPGFEWIYIHVGNTQIDTDGCLLVGNTANTKSIANSVKAFKSVYDMIGKALMNGESVTIVVNDVL